MDKYRVEIEDTLKLIARQVPTAAVEEEPDDNIPAAMDDDGQQGTDRAHAQTESQQRQRTMDDATFQQRQLWHDLDLHLGFVGAGTYT